MKLDVPLIEIATVPVEQFTPIRETAWRLTEAEWGADTERQDSFRCHRETQAIPLLYGRNMNDRRESPAWSNTWKALLMPTLGPVLRERYGAGQIVRSCIVNLLPMAKVLAHKDDTEEILFHTHRIHLPLKTNPLVDFVVEAERFYLEEGHLYEFSNQVFHHVVNRSNENRIHLILDYLEQDVIEEFERKHREAPPKVWKTSYGDPAMAGND